MKQRIILFEDADVVFSDEGDFFKEILKLSRVSRVPIVVSFSKLDLIAPLISMFEKEDLVYDEAKYQLDSENMKERAAVSLGIIRLIEMEQTQQEAGMPDFDSILRRALVVAEKMLEGPSKI